MLPFHPAQKEYAQDKAYQDDDRKKDFYSQACWHPSATHGQKRREYANARENAEDEQRNRKKVAQKLSSPQENSSDNHGREQYSQIQDMHRIG